ncbi:sigma-70 family RNA polymerase sigma factor [Actinoplanes sp. NPDC051861]|uniref:RNA polymerase sigma factor n=1 Tax=Actinoplanes sp. NPDC051861 TaxID=3155170 RepID=UPI0034163EE8
MSNGLEDVLREAAPGVVAVLARRYGDFGAAEDAVQEALIAATDNWGRSGVPENPRAWLTRTASRKFLDAARSDQARRRREVLAAMREVPGEARERDDTLTLLLLCCHPSLTPASAIPLTLRAVGGLTTAEIANAFLVPEATMAQRISRAKARIKSSGTPLRMPDPAERPERLRSVRHVLYLIFNEGYAVSTGPHLQRLELSAEAIRLTRMLHRLVPSDGETAGLLALMLLTDARRDARTGPNGELIPLDEQDRSRWDRTLIAEGTGLLDAAFSRGAVGEYQLQAAIAALHARAARPEQTDWPQILALYGVLEKITGNPVVRLNRAVAAAMAAGPDEGLALLDGLEGVPRFRVDAVRAHLYEMAGDPRAAAELYRSAAAGTDSLPQQRYLITRAARLNQATR